MNELRILDFQGKKLRMVMIDGEPWWVAKDVCEVQSMLPKKLPIYFGCIYAVEYGGLVKVGMTTNPLSRVKSLASLARNYGPGHVGAVILSHPHTNFRENEKRLHQLFADRRVKGELFQISLAEFAEAAARLEFRDDSASLDEQSRAVTSFFKSVVTGDLFRERGL